MRPTDPVPRTGAPYDGAAYQRMLLAALGDDDPAEVATGTPEVLRALVADAAADLTLRPEPGEWSVLGCIAHIVDAEVVMSGRYRWVLAHDEPELAPYDQDLWVDRLHHGERDADGMLALFAPLRAANVALWGRTDAAGRARVGLHRERGPESFELMFRMIAGHDRVHVAQARRALAQVRSDR
jgi:hypothetical protein